MKFGLWFLSAAGVGAVGTLLAASLPVPPSLPSIPARHVRAVPTQVAATAAPPEATTPPAVPYTPPATTPPQAAAPPHAAAAAPPQSTVPPQAAVASRPAVPPAPVAARPKRVVAATNANHSTNPNEKAKRPTRTLAKATPDRHRRTVAHAVPKPPPPYPWTPPRERTHVAMAPPPYGMPPPYWRMPYPPEY